MFKASHDIRCGMARKTSIKCTRDYEFMSPQKSEIFLFSFPLRVRICANCFLGVKRMWRLTFVLTFESASNLRWCHFWSCCQISCLRSGDENERKGNLRWVEVIIRRFGRKLLDKTSRSFLEVMKTRVKKVTWILFMLSNFNFFRLSHWKSNNKNSRNFVMMTTWIV